MTVAAPGVAVRGSAAPYVVALVAADVAATVVGVLGSPAEGDLPLQYLVFAVGLTVSVALWWRYRPAARLPRVQAAGLALMAAMWLAVLVRTLAYGQVPGPVSVSVALLLAMLWIKPPDPAGARGVVDGISWLLVGAAIVALAWEVLGWADSWYVRLGMDPGLPEFDRAYYWLPLADVLGLDGRWAGPFVHPNHAGLVGGLLLLVGLCRSGVRRWAFTGTGLLVLVLVQSRTSTVAAAAGLLTVTLILWRTGGLDRSRRWLAAGAGAAILALLVVPLVRGITGSASGGDYLASYGTAMGRSEVWRAYLALWQESPLLGIPDARIVAAARDGDLPGWAATAHNLLLDTLARMGVLGALLLVALLAAVAVGSLGAARRGAAASAGLVALLLVSGMTEALVVWDRFATGTVVLLLAWAASLEVRDREPVIERRAHPS